MMQNGDLTKAEDAREKGRVLKEALDQLDKSDQQQEIDELSLPLPVSADYICGKSKQERLTEFTRIIKDLMDQRLDLKNNLKQALEGFKDVHQTEVSCQVTKKENNL